MSDCEPVRQCGAICRIGSDIVLVSNKSGTRWVIPKGHFEEHDTFAHQRAAQEAWEEAGVKGSVQSEPRGHFFYSKHGLIYRVSVFLMEDCSVSETWPEHQLRERVLVSPRQASEMVIEEGLKELLGVIDPSVEGEKGSSIARHDIGR